MFEAIVSTRTAATGQKRENYLTSRMARDLVLHGSEDVGLVYSGVRYAR